MRKGRTLWFTALGGCLLGLGACALLLAPSRPATGQEQGAPKTVQGQLVEFRSGDPDVVIFTAREEGQRWRYRLPVSDRAVIRVGEERARPTALEEGMNVRVTFRRLGGQNVVTAIAAQAEGAQRAAGREPREERAIRTGRQPGRGLPQPREGEALALAYPTGERESSVILIEAKGPNEARVGEPFEYQIQVTNLTEHLVLQDVLVRQKLAEGVEVVRADLPGQEQQARDGRQGQGGQRQQGRTRQQDGQRQGRQRQQDQGADDQGEGRQRRQDREGQQDRQARQQDRGFGRQPVRKGGDQEDGRQQDRQARQQDRQADGQQQQAGQGRQQGQQGRQTAEQGRGQQGQGGRQQTRYGQMGQGRQGGERRYLIERLMPGESQTISVTLVGHEQGAAVGCIGVLYTPVLCMQTQFVKPDLEVVKKAPDVVDLCDPFTFTYVVKNTGSAPAVGVVVRDNLPTGLRLAEAREGRQGQDNVVTFEVGQLPPGEAREFAAKVVAEHAGRFTSRAVAVTENDLRAVSARTTTVVEQVRLTASIEGPQAEYIGQPMEFKITVRNRGDAPAEDTRLRVKLGDGARIVNVSGVEGQGRQRDRDAAAPAAWELGTLEPGEEKQVSLTVIGRNEGQFKLAAHAESDCARDIAEAEATAVQVVKVMVLPALRLEVVDQRDPVKVGDTTVYSLSVINQGTGPDENVVLTMKLPQQFEFVEASGPSKVKAEGQTLRFTPVGVLEAGDQATWQVQVRAKAPGDVQTRVEMTSDYLSNPVPDVEPTRIIK